MFVDSIKSDKLLYHSDNNILGRNLLSVNSQLLKDLKKYRFSRASATKQFCLLKSLNCKYCKYCKFKSSNCINWSLNAFSFV